MHQQSRSEDSQIDSRIRSFELAYRMQMDATENAFDLSKEPQHVLRSVRRYTTGRTAGLDCPTAWPSAGCVLCSFGTLPGTARDGLATTLKCSTENWRSESDQGTGALLIDRETVEGCSTTLWWCGPASLVARRRSSCPRPDPMGAKSTAVITITGDFSARTAGGGVKGGTIYRSH
jgi:hypothetical protein